MSLNEKILITGANGFIGSHIARGLVKRGFSVAGFVRKGSSLENIDSIADKLELFFGDIRNPSDVCKAVAKAKVVIHTAALVKSGQFGLADYIATNLGGTMNVVEAAIKAGVKRLVYTSSCETLRISSKTRRSKGLIGKELNEQSPSTLGDMMLDYGHSKYLAEEHVKGAANLGLEAVILNPTAVMGPNDINLTAPNKLLLSYLRGRVPLFFETGFNIVDVRDVASAHINAITQGSVGQRYLIGGTNVMLTELFGMLKKISGRKPISFPLPFRVIKTAAKIVPVKKLRETIAGSEFPFFLDSRLAKMELGWQAERPLEKTLQDALEYFTNKGRI